MSGSKSRQSIGRQLGSALGWGISLGLSLWIAETLNLMTAYGQSGGSVLLKASALIFALLLPLGAATGFAFFLGHLIGRTGGRELWYRRLWRWTSTGGAVTQHGRGAQMLAAWLLLHAGAVTLYAVNRKLLRVIVQERFEAILAAGVAVSVLGLAVVTYPQVRGFSYRIVRLLSFLPLTGWLVRRSYNVAAVLLAATAILLGVWVRREWVDVFSVAPWTPVLVIAGACALSLVVHACFAPLLRRRAGALLCAVLLLSAAGGAGAWAWTLSPYEWGARQLAFQSSPSGKLIYRTIVRYADFDGDGYLAFLGGGDCDESDGEINPAALDVPDNGIDEDCSGQDLSRSGFTRGGIFDYPVSEEIPAQPNVVLITIDAFAARHSKIQGYARDVTPNIDAFARESVLFDACFAQGPSTRLSFPAMFTSRWDSQLRRVPGARMPRSLVGGTMQMQNLFEANGYDTAAVISTPYFSRVRWASMVRDFDEVDESVMGETPHNTPQLTEVALEQIGRTRENPFFLWVHYYDAHSPFDEVEDFEAFGDTPRDRYDTELRYLDQEIKPLLDALRERDDTVTFITSDHGTVFHPEPRTRRGRYGYDLYTATLHVPLIVHAGFMQPHRFDHPVSTLDILPTMANLLRWEGEEDFEGYSLVPEVLDGQESRPPRVYSQFYLPERAASGQAALAMVGIHTDTHNLVFNREDAYYEFYQWRDDYFEQQNEQGRRSEQMDEMRDDLGAFIYYVLDPPSADPERLEGLRRVREAAARDRAQNAADAGANDGAVPVPSLAPSPQALPRHLRELTFGSDVLGGPEPDEDDSEETAEGNDTPQ